MTEQEVAPAGRTLAEDIAFASRIGATPEGGITRVAFSPPLAEVTDWVAGQLAELGLVPRTDAAGNLIAEWEAPAGPAVMTASHLDTVPNGGAFDGALGVLCGLEAIRALRREGFEPARPIWVGAFMDEEGTRFGNALFGSRCFCGEDIEGALDQADADGRTLREVMTEQGLAPDRLAEANRVGEVGAYLELHVEQGPVLWERGERLGVVQAIAGVLGLRVQVDGEANHAGTTPMEMRRDALAAAARMVLAIRRRASEDPAMRATVGRVELSPGATNVIPGRCRFTVDMRIADPAHVEAGEAWLRQTVRDLAAEERVSATVVRDYALAPAAMDADVTAAIDAAARAEDVEPLAMVSGAGHDAMVVARHAPAGMLFVPSRDGLSHSPREWSALEDCELGARVLAGALRRLAS
jgi:hydantoinase/carbamoylase family amidase